ncbi:MAG TPA: hypothetical protein VME22_28735 [Solirubrobacteraceae bacterium]|nr:hypothetical protein [Solirubrobacteraceae bacterium]
MTDDYDLDWFAQHRPHPDPPSRAATRHARSALIAHGVGRRRARRRAGGLAAAGVVAVAAVVLFVTSGTTRPAASPRVSIAVAPFITSHGTMPSGAIAAAPTPLMRLAADVHRLSSPPQPGDATLVVRDTFLDGQHVIDGAVYGGYDLYTDSGQYYYAPDSLAQLQQIFDTHQVVIDSGNEAHRLDVLAGAAGDTPAQARAALLSTEPNDGRGPTPAQEKAFLRQLPPRLRSRFEAAARHPDLRLSEDSEIWGDATEALAVGAGRPDVRAAAIKALSTLEGVTQTSTRVDGVSALKVSFPDGNYLEQIWLDATTGVPIEEKDGDNSATAYAVERVTATQLPAQIPSAARLR